MKISLIYRKKKSSLVVSYKDSILLYNRNDWKTNRESVKQISNIKLKYTSAVATRFGL
jgi:hypothetical protein